MYTKWLKVQLLFHYRLGIAIYEQNTTSYARYAQPRSLYGCVWNTKHKSNCWWLPQPGANLKKLYVSKQLNDEVAISRFAEKYIVSVNSVKNYIEHLRNLERMKNIRSRHRLEVQKKRENKNYNDYDWLQLFISGTLEKLNVKELNKYLDMHKLPKYRKLKRRKSRHNINAHTWNTWI